MKGTPRAHLDLQAHSTTPQRRRPQGGRGQCDGRAHQEGKVPRQERVQWEIGLLGAGGFRLFIPGFWFLLVVWLVGVGAWPMLGLRIRYFFGFFFVGSKDGPGVVIIDMGAHLRGS